MLAVSFEPDFGRGKDVSIKLHLHACFFWAVQK